MGSVSGLYYTIKYGSTKEHSNSDALRDYPYHQITAYTTDRSNVFELRHFSCNSTKERKYKATDKKETVLNQLYQAVQRGTWSEIFSDFFLGVFNPDNA